MNAATCVAVAFGYILVTKMPSLVAKPFMRLGGFAALVGRLPVQLLVSLVMAFSNPAFVYPTHVAVPLLLGLRALRALRGLGATFLVVSSASAKVMRAIMFLISFICVLSAYAYVFTYATVVSNLDGLLWVYTSCAHPKLIHPRGRKRASCAWVNECQGNVNSSTYVPVCAYARLPSVA